MQLQVETQIYKKDAIGNGINEAGTKADYYITYISPEKGIQVHNQYTQSFDKTGTPPYGNYVQINGDDISMWRANKEKMRLDATALNFYGYSNNNQHLLASYGDGLVLYKPGVGSGADTPVVSINSSGANIDGSVTIGGKIQGDYLNSNIQVGGNNLLIGTAASVSKSTTATTSYVTQALYSTSDLKMLSELGFSVDDEITLSFDWKITSASTYGNARIEWYGKTDSSDNTYIAPLISPFATFSASKTSGHVEKTVKLTSATIQAKRLVLRIDNSNLTLTISNLKLEKGNKATSWSPAPEDLEKSYYGNCETAAATADKQVSCAGFNLKTGAIVGIKFTNGNTCESNITLNINGTGAKTVYFLGQTTGTDSRLNVSLAANAVVSVIYDGTYWRILSIDQTSTMVTRIGDNGISIHPSGTTQHRVEINSSGMNVYRNNTSIAEYGTNARIGSANGQRFLINAGSLQAYDSNSNMYFEVSSTGIKFGQNIQVATQTEATNAGKTATNYLSFDNSNGLRIAQSTSDFSKPYVQITSNGVKTIYNNNYFTNLTSSGLNIHAGHETYPIATYGSTIVFFEPGTTTKAAEITSSGINIKAGTIKLGEYFEVSTTGALTAKSGTIGGFYISGTELDAYGTASGAGTSSTGLYRVLMNANPGANGGNVALGVATRSSTSASWEWKAYINYNGTLVAKSANISGTITAGANSTIGPWTVTDSAIYNGKTGVTTTTAGVYLGTDGLNISGGTAATTAYITKSAVNIGNKIIWNGSTLKIQADEITMGGHSVDTGGTWYTGTAITGTSTTATIFSSSGISYALVGDMYLNTSTNNTYRCTVAGNASTAKWVYVSNLKGSTGGNGQSYYVHIRYSANSDGTNFTASPQTNTQYIGIYSGTSSSAPTAKTSYTWSKYKGEKGDDTSSQYMTFTTTNGLRIYSGDKNSSTYNTVYTQIKTDGITIRKDDAHKTIIDGNGMSIYAGGSSAVAQFGSTITLGQASQTQIYINSTGADAGIKFITQYKDTSNVVKNFYLGDIGFDSTSGWTNNPTEDKGYFPVGAWATFGFRAFNSFKGYYSFVSGFNNVASHNASVAFGINNKVYGSCGFASGINNIIGDSSKTSKNSYTAGNIGNCCAAIGTELLIGNTENQLVCGYRNQADTNATFIVGGGNSSSRFNLFTVTNSGRIQTTANGYASNQAQASVGIQYSTGFREEIWMGVGSGGDNKGLYDPVHNQWILFLKNTSSTSQKISTSFGGFSTTSDLKRKNIIGPIDYATDFIMSLKPKQYYWKDDKYKKINLGFVAQEVDQIGNKLNLDLNIALAQYKDKSKGEYHGGAVDDSELEWFLDYNEIIAPLVQVVQDQQKEIEQLKKEIKDLKNK